VIIADAIVTVWQYFEREKNEGKGKNLII